MEQLKQFDHNIQSDNLHYYSSPMVKKKNKTKTATQSSKSLKREPEERSPLVEDTSAVAMMDLQTASQTPSLSVVNARQDIVSSTEIQ